LLEGAVLDVAGVSVSAADVVVQRQAHQGVVVETAGGLAVAIDTTLDDDLVVLGAAREVISRIQGARRELDLAVTDRITVTWSSGDESVISAFARHGDVIAGETLATALEQVDGAPAQTDGFDLRLTLTRN
jgi:isoleucyl-tRNA synthetase